MLPFPSLGRILTGTETATTAAALNRPVGESVATWIRSLPGSPGYDATLRTVLVAHLNVTGADVGRGMFGVGEGSVVVLDSAALPAGFDYVALGHVHKPQCIRELAHVRYCRVSRGDVRFEPPDPAGTLPFDLNVRRIGSPEPIPVGNLSGGQRCRAAVSLALAVCRFACGEAQPLQPAIIDEAFANLDRGGRMATTEVIRDGRIAGDILRRIIVVSHHEDVAAAFPAGDRLVTEGGATAVTRFEP